MLVDFVTNQRRCVSAIDGIKGWVKLPVAKGELTCTKTMHSIVWPAGAANSGCKKTNNGRLWTHKSPRFIPFHTVKTFFVSLNRLLKKWQIGYVVHFAWPEGEWMLGTCCTPGPIIAHLCLEEIPLLLFFFKTDQSLKMALIMKLISGRSGVEKYTEIIPKCAIWERLTHNNINVQTFVTNLI